MSSKYKQPFQTGATRFSKAPVADIEFSRMTATPKVLTTYNAGDIVPIACWEVLPNDTFSVSVDFVNRLASAVIKPTMGTMQLDLYAYFVPNRIINDSWKNVQGENSSGAWAAPEIELAPLYPVQKTAPVQIPVGSVADYYGYPTQAPIQAQHLQRMHDLKFRGYLSIYNEWFRDQNYTPPIPFSKLNVYEGFLEPVNSRISLDGAEVNATSVGAGGGQSMSTDGSYPRGAILKALYGEGADQAYTAGCSISSHLSVWSALDRPLKANKLHDAFTSVLPSPQKGSQVYFGVGDKAPLNTGTYDKYTLSSPLIFGIDDPNGDIVSRTKLGLTIDVRTADGVTEGDLAATAMTTGNTSYTITDTNLYADLSQATGVSINDLRLAVATQQVYEVLSRSGSRYRSVLNALFGLDVDDPFSDIPRELGHIRRELDLYQVAQTSASQEGNTAQGDLAAFGYTSSGGDFFNSTFVEHGYIHILAVVRHRNSYSTLLAPDNFRRTTLDFYNPVLANIGEQPIRTAVLNPFIADDNDSVLGYQEAWWEYRHQPDTVSGLFRSGINNGLDIWTYADPYDASFNVVTSDWLMSNSKEVLDRSLAVTSAVSDQFLAMFAFKVTKQRPMPTYSVPGLDTI